MKHGEMDPGMLRAYLDGQLDQGQAAAIEQHLEGCAACRRSLRFCAAMRRVCRTI